MTWSEKFLNHYSTHSLSKEEIDECLKSLREWAQQTISPDQKITKPWLTRLIHQADKLWFDGKLIPELIKEFESFTVVVVNREEIVAGFTQEKSHTILLGINDYLFNNIFKQNERSFHAGGLVCSSKIFCLINIVLHEMVHLFLTLCESQCLHSNKKHHNKTFMKLVQHLFGQDDSLHGLIEGFEQVHDLAMIKSHLKPGLKVEVFLGKKTKWTPAIVIKLYKKNVVLELPNNKQIKVHPGLVRLVHL